MRVHRRRHDDAHRPLSGRGQRGNTLGKTPNWGGAVLVEVQRCKACGQCLPHGCFGCDKSNEALAQRDLADSGETQVSK